MGKREKVPEAEPVAADRNADAAAELVGTLAGEKLVEDGADPALLSELEDGIVSVFQALQAEAEGDPSRGEDDGKPADDAELATFLLLGELDRLWQQAA